MKRLLTMVLAAAFVLGTVSAANAAIDVKASGTWDFAFGWYDNASFDDDNQDDNFLAAQRVRVQANFIASENLQGVVMFEIGTWDWGNGGAALDADQTDVEVKRAYLDWMIPSTDVSVRMGVQGLSLPMATGYGHPVLANDVAAIVVNVPFNDMIGLTAFWARPFDASDENVYKDEKLSDEMDMFGLMLPINGEGWSFTPWGVYARIGAGSGLMEYFNEDFYKDNDLRSAGGDSSNAWWAGFAFELSMFDPLTFSMDAMYGRIGEFDYRHYDKDNKVYLPGHGTFEMKGWFIDAALDYKLDWGTVGIFGWYSTGDDKDDVSNGEFGRIPGFSDDGYDVTGLGAPGTMSIGTDGLISDMMTGTWGVGVKLADVSFIEDLSHTLRVTYYRGTNDSEIIRDGKWDFAGLSKGDTYMTDDDYAVEINFDHTYQLYENLTMVVELGYIFMEADHDTWKGYKGDSTDLGESDNAWKAQVLFRYKF